MLAYSKLIFLYKNGDGEEQIICPNGSLTVSDIVFKIAPKINAAGRMKNARDAINLLLATDETEALQYFTTVVEQNSERQKEEKRICEEAFAMIEENAAAQSLFSTVLYRDSWHKGVVGIAAIWIAGSLLFRLAQYVASRLGNDELALALTVGALVGTPLVLVLVYIVCECCLSAAEALRDGFGKLASWHGGIVVVFTVGVLIVGGILWGVFAISNAVSKKIFKRSLMHVVQRLMQWPNKKKPTLCLYNNLYKT